MQWWRVSEGEEDKRVEITFRSETDLLHLLRLLMEWWAFKKSFHSCARFLPSKMFEGIVLAKWLITFRDLTFFMLFFRIPSQLLRSSSPVPLLPEWKMRDGRRRTRSWGDFFFFLPSSQSFLPTLIPTIFPLLLSLSFFFLFTLISLSSLLLKICWNGFEITLCVLFPPSKGCFLKMCSLVWNSFLAEPHHGYVMLTWLWRAERKRKTSRRNFHLLSAAGERRTSAAAAVEVEVLVSGKREKRQHVVVVDCNRFERKKMKDFPIRGKEMMMMIWHWICTSEGFGWRRSRGTTTCVPSIPVFEPSDPGLLLLPSSHTHYTHTYRQNNNKETAFSRGRFWDETAMMMMAKQADPYHTPIDCCLFLIETFYHSMHTAFALLPSWLTLAYKHLRIQQGSWCFMHHHFGLWNTCWVYFLIRLLFSRWFTGGRTS